MNTKVLRATLVALLHTLAVACGGTSEQHPELDGCDSGSPEFSDCTEVVVCARTVYSCANGFVVSPVGAPGEGVSLFECSTESSIGFPNLSCLAAQQEAMAVAGCGDGG